MTMLELLNSTIEYYSVNPKERRCTQEGGKCTYSPITADKPNSDGCAIGRHLTPEVKLMLDKSGYISVAVIIKHKEMKELLPEWMREIGLQFLSAIQELHDKSENWDNKGLSRRGIQAVETIVRDYNLLKPSIL